MIISSMILLFSSINVEALTLEQGDIIKSNESSLGYYVINYTTDFLLIEVNDTFVKFTSSDGLPHYCYDVDNSIQLCTKAVVCIIPQTNSIININFSDIGGASGGFDYTERFCVYDEDCEYEYECVKFKCIPLECREDEKISNDGHKCKIVTIQHTSQSDYILYYGIPIIFIFFILFFAWKRRKKKKKKVIHKPIKKKSDKSPQ